MERCQIEGQKGNIQEAANKTRPLRVQPGEEEQRHAHPFFQGTITKIGLSPMLFGSGSDCWSPEFDWHNVPDTKSPFPPFASAV